MRLAAMTGMDKELARFADTESGRSAVGRNGGAALATTRATPRSGKSPRGARAGHDGGYMWLWIVSLVAVLAAVALFLFR